MTPKITAFVWMGMLNSELRAPTDTGLKCPDEGGLSVLTSAHWWLSGPLATGQASDRLDALHSKANITGKSSLGTNYSRSDRTVAVSWWSDVCTLNTCEERRWIFTVFQ